MGGVLRFVSNLFWGGVWLIVALVVAYGILRIGSQLGGGSLVGRVARGAAHYASPAGIGQ